MGLVLRHRNCFLEVYKNYSGYDCADDYLFHVCYYSHIRIPAAWASFIILSRIVRASFTSFVLSENLTRRVVASSHTVRLHHQDPPFL